MVCRSSLRFSAPKNALTSDALMQYHHLMRTTLDIEEDVLEAAKERARAEGSTAGKVISRMARKGFVGEPGQTRKAEVRNGVPLLPRRGVLVTDSFVNKLRDEEGI